MTLYRLMRDGRRYTIHAESKEEAAWKLNEKLTPATNPIFEVNVVLRAPGKAPRFLRVASRDKAEARKKVLAWIAHK